MVRPHSNDANRLPFLFVFSECAVRVTSLAASFYFSRLRAWYNAIIHFRPTLVVYRISVAAAAAINGVSTGSHSQLLAIHTQHRHTVHDHYGVAANFRQFVKFTIRIHVEHSIWTTRGNVWNVKNAFDAHGYLHFLLKNRILPIIIGNMRCSPLNGIVETMAQSHNRSVHR